MFFNHTFWIICFQIQEIIISWDFSRQQSLLSFCNKFRVYEIQHFSYLFCCWVANWICNVVHNVSQSCCRNFEIIRPKFYGESLRVFIIKEQHFVHFINQYTFLSWKFPAQCILNNPFLIDLNIWIKNNKLTSWPIVGGFSISTTDASKDIFFKRSLSFWDKSLLGNGILLFA